MSKAIELLNEIIKSNSDIRVYVKYYRYSSGSIDIRNVYPSVIAVDNKGSIIVQDNLIFVKNWLKNQGYTNISYEDNMDKKDWFKNIGLNSEPG